MKRTIENVLEILVMLFPLFVGIIIGLMLYSSIKRDNTSEYMIACLKSVKTDGGIKTCYELFSNNSEDRE